MEGMSKDKPWQCKEGSLRLLRKLATSAKAQVQEALPEIVPVGSECMVDAREQVRI
jgi:elongation factor 3